MRTNIANLLYRIAIISAARGALALGWCLMVAYFARSEPGAYLPFIAFSFLVLASGSGEERYDMT